MRCFKVVANYISISVLALACFVAALFGVCFAGIKTAVFFGLAPDFGFLFMLFYLAVAIGGLIGVAECRRSA